MEGVLSESVSSEWSRIDLESEPCFVCGQTLGNRVKLKSHLLIKHSNLHVCLFCVDRKGWSDTFATQSSYNEHFRSRHQRDQPILGKERKRQEVKRQRVEELKEYERARMEAIKNGTKLPKRPSRRLYCTDCSPRVQF